MDKDKLIELIKKKIENAQNDVMRIHEELKKNESIKIDLLDTLTLLRGQIMSYVDILSILERGKI